MLADSGRSRRLNSRVFIVVCLAVGIATFGAIVLWALPALLTRHPSAGLTAAERLKAANDVRTPVIAFLIAVGAAGTLWFTARTYSLNRQGHVTDRYTSAVSQLGDPSLHVHVGGIYALERIARDSSGDRMTIIYVLGAFIRERSRAARQGPDQPPAEDALAALRVAARLVAMSEVKLDLRGADLRNFDLSDLPPGGVLLEGANLQGAVLPRQSGRTGTGSQVQQDKPRDDWAGQRGT
jgi:hypothetical protein